MEFTWAGANSWIAVVNDGWGMTVEELGTAMTVTARGPATPRSSTDLASIFRDGPSVSLVGRFGVVGWSWVGRWPGCR
ncbi:hypothetical protein ACFYRV_29450, partial [Streptomyces scopuliridis]